MVVAHLALLGLATVAGLAQAANFELTILHTNDVHARVTSSLEQGELFGGAARRATKVQEIRKAKENVLLLDAGDQFQGTVWFNVYEGQEAAHFMNMIKYDAQGLGNHEFDRGSPILSDYIDRAEFPVMACNVDVTQDKLLAGKIKPYVIVEKSGRKIAIIGYVTEDTVFLAMPSRETIFTPVAEAIPKTVQEIKEKYPEINIIIAVGHSGNPVDLQLARDNPDVDIIVGGHTNTFIFTGEQLHSEVPEGPYPQVIEHDDGRVNVVVTAFAFGKYLGELDATFDDDGNLLSHKGNPIILSNTTTDLYTATEEDPIVAAEVAIWEKNVTDLMEKQVGSNMLFLMGDRIVCRHEECNLGNLLADSYVQFFMRIANRGNLKYTPLMAWLNGGSVRSDIDVGNVTMAQLLEVVPFQNTMVVLHLQGKDIKPALEHAVGSIEVGEGRFPQISGFQFTFDPEAPSGSRVVDIRVPCLTCRHPMLVPVNDTETYHFITSEYLALGGDGFTMWANKQIDDFSILDSDPVVDYFYRNSPVHVTEQGRIMRIPGIASFSAATVETENDTEATAESAAVSGECPECPANTSSCGTNAAAIVLGITTGIAAIAALAFGVLFYKLRARVQSKTAEESRVSMG